LWENEGMVRKRPPGLARDLYGTEHNHSPFYNAWVHMNTRCHNPNYEHWAHYGGRGITVCERWANFENFVDDMYPTWSEGLTIDRIDNDGPYSPENCRWTTQAEQALNRSVNHHLTYQGRTMTVKEWSVEMGINYWALYWRINHGWSIEKALTTPSATTKS
jgi:hypothetical protein